MMEEEKDFRVRRVTTLITDIDFWSRHYIEHRFKSWFPGLIRDMAENPLILAIDWQQPENCSHEDAIRICRRLLGDSDPQKSELGTIRFTFSCHKRFNFCHISDSVESNEYEMKNVFG